MSMSAKKPSLVPAGLKRFVLRARSRSSTFVVLGAAILLIDLFTGPLLQFPILFVIPVTLSAWFCSSRLAYALAVLLPVGRLFIAAYVDLPSSFAFIAANCLIRVAVLVFIAFLVCRTARQTKELEQQVNNLVTICAWTRTVEYQGEWISFEDYLKRRFNISTTHSISPAEAEKVLGQLEENGRNA